MSNHRPSIRFEPINAFVRSKAMQLITHRESVIWVYCWTHARDDGAFACPPKTIAKQTGLRLNHVYGAIADLLHKGLFHPLDPPEVVEFFVFDLRLASAREIHEVSPNLGSIPNRDKRKRRIQSPKLGPETIPNRDQIESQIGTEKHPKLGSSHYIDVQTTIQTKIKTNVQGGRIPLRPPLALRSKKTATPTASERTATDWIRNLLADRGLPEMQKTDGKFISRMLATAEHSLKLFSEAVISIDAGLMIHALPVNCQRLNQCMNNAVRWLTLGVEPFQPLRLGITSHCKRWKAYEAFLRTIKSSIVVNRIPEPERPSEVRLMRLFAACDCDAANAMTVLSPMINTGPSQFDWRKIESLIEMKVGEAA